MRYCTSDLVSAANYNGLTYFLFSNLLTGLVNMSMRTIYQSKVNAMLILTGYMFVLSLISFILYKRKIQLKIWWCITNSHSIISNSPITVKCSNHCWRRFCLFSFNYLNISNNCFLFSWIIFSHFLWLSFVIIAFSWILFFPFFLWLSFV